MPRKKISSPGFTMIEMVIVIGVFATIIAGLWVLFSSVQENSRVATADRQLKQIVMNARTVYARQASFTSSTDVTAELDSMDVFPADMRSGANSATLKNGKINHPWSSNAGGTIRVLTITAGNLISLVYGPLPRKACIDAATRLSGNEISGLDNVQINGTMYSNAAGTLPIGAVTADLKCSYATGNSISWNYTMR